tara:strand:+ start:2931 stop:3146 length:216 start_codon:yes stop_codon:yes gene_type:complete
VPRGQADYQALQFALGDPIKFFTDDLVVPAEDTFGPHMLNKIYKVVLALVLLVHLVVAGQQGQSFVLILLA